MRPILLGMLFVALATPAVAQQPAQAPGVLEQVYACATVGEEAARLRCYDDAVGRLRAAQTSGELVAVDRGQVQQIERESFGFSLPSLPRIFQRTETPGAEPERTESLTAQVSGVRQRNTGIYVITLANGQVWEQTDQLPPRRLRAGDTVEIRRATFGSYLLHYDRGPAVRVRRIE
ncbi:MAG: hypothetical protein JNK94_00215 [Hyphomonadaceae bacterium]|nr:hypothetical protein [Hyphomonadaceae bacterium]